MSSKIRVGFIVRKHLGAALTDSQSNRILWKDALSFFGLPLTLGLLTYAAALSDKSGLINLLMTVSSIFAGLLLNLLVLVYDQNKRIKEKKVELEHDYSNKPQPAASLDALLATQSQSVASNPRYQVYSKHEQILLEMLSSISYAILVSLLSVATGIISFLLPESLPIHIYGHDATLQLKSIMVSLNVFLAGNLILTVVMIVKRVYRLITASD